MKIYFDGGARPNPGPLEIAVVVGGRTIFHDDPRGGDHAEAEWRAVCAALETARGVTGRAVLLGDSEHALARARRDPAFAGTTLRKVARGRNLAGIALDRRRDATRSRPGPVPSQPRT